MKIISVVTQKGGSGKTTLCRHIAVGAFLAGYPTVIVDTDPMGGSREWGDRRDRDPFVVAEQSLNPDHLKRTIDRCRAGGAEVVVIDTAGHHGSIPINAAIMSDITLVPVRPTPDDLTALWQTVKEMREQKVQFRIVLSQVPTNTQRPRSDAAALLADNRTPIAPVVIHHKGIVPLSGVTGETVFEMRGLTEAEQKSVDEFKALWAWLEGELGLPAMGQEGMRAAG